MNIGDIVKLKSGGPNMVVISQCECGTLEVAWADGEGGVSIDVFPEACLAAPGHTVDRLTVSLEVDTSAFEDALKSLAAEARRTVSGIYDDMRTRRV